MNRLGSVFDNHMNGEDDWAEDYARDMQADTEPRNDSDTCECGNRKSERADFCRACAVADEREEER